MNIYDNSNYMEDVNSMASLTLPWERLKNKSLMLSGATGLIGSFLVDVILEKNIRDNLNCTVYALGRNKEKAVNRFSKYINDPHLIFIPYDVKLPLVLDDVGTIDYVLHLAVCLSAFIDSCYLEATRFLVGTLVLGVKTKRC